MNKRVLPLFNWLVVVATLTMAIGLAPVSAAPPTSTAAPIPPLAPAAAYTFSSSVGAYTEITGGATYGTATNDDTSFNAINIGFPFSYSGPSYTTVYTQVSIQSNGFIAMGPSVSSSYYPISTGSSNNVVSALGRDLQGQTTGVITAELSSLVQGSAPNRTFTIQWKHYKAYGSGNVGDDFNFQIVLHETTNVIDLIYGSFVVTTTAKTVETGLRGNTNADFNNRTTTTNWTASTAGTTNADTMALTTSVYPPSGLKYTFTPPPARPAYTTSTKSASAGTVSNGQLLTYTVNINNTGDMDGVGTTLVDPIPAGTSFVSIVTPPAATYNAGQNRVEWTGTVAQAASVNVTFVVSVTGAGLPCPATITNMATISQSVLAAPVSVSATTAYWTKLRYAEDFEASNGGYVASGTNSTWAWGTPTSGPSAAHSGTKLWATNLAGSYNASENSYLESPVVDLHAYVAVPGYPLYLSWWQWQYTESGYDYFSVDVSSNGGASWTTVYGPISGSYQSWQNQQVDISAYASSNFKARFHLTSDSSVQYAGMYIDDVSIQNCAPPPAIYVIPASQMGQGCPAGNAGYQFNIMNLADELGVTASFAQASGLGALGFNPPTLTVAYGPNNQGTFNVTHTLPSYLFDGQTATAVLSATAGIYNSTAQVATTAGNNWLTAQSGGAPALWPAYADDGDTFYYIDGKDAAGNPTNRVQMFTPGMGWSAGMTHTTAASYGGVADYYGGKVYYASGFQTGMVGDMAFAAYDPVANTWAPLAPKPQALGLGAGGVTSNGVFVWAGGSPNNGLLGTTPVYTYNIATNTWYTGATLSAVGFTAPGYVIAGNKLYVGGNYFGSNAFYVYNVAANTWTKLADLPAGAGKLSPLLINVEDDIYLIGGGNSPAAASTATWRYNITANTWDTFTALPTALLGSGGGYVGGELYVFGGGSNATSAQSPAPHYVNIPACAYPNLANLTGRVTNGATGAGIAGATVSAQGLREVTAPKPTPSTNTDASGYYTLTLNPAVYNVTAAKSPFDSKSAVVTVTVSGATQNFQLGPATTQAAPNAFNVTAHYSETLQRTLVVTNSGYSNLNLQLVEYNGGFAPPVLGTFEYLPLPATDVKTNGPLPGLVFNGTGTPPAATRPAAYIYHGPNEAIQAARILVYADDDQRTPTAVELGLQSLGLTYTFYGYTADGSALSSWVTALTTGGPWDLVIMAEDSWTLTLGGDYDAMNTFINGGGKALAHSWAVGYDSTHSGHALWTTMAATYESWVTSPTSLYWWVPSHPLFNTPESVPQFTSLTNLGYLAYGAMMDPTANGDVLGGFATTQTPNVGGVILRKDGKTLYKGLTDNLNGADLDADGMLDAAEWWANAVNGVLNGFGGAGGDIPWLTEVPTKTTILPQSSATVVLTFDAKTVSALGVYTGSLVLQGGTQPLTVPVQMNVVDNLSVTPTRLERTLPWGQTANDVSTLNNVGATSVNYQITNLPIKKALYENFDTWTAKDAPPAGWMITRTDGTCANGNSLPQWQSSAVTGRATFGSGYYAAADVDKCGSGSSMDTALFSPPIDLTSAALAKLAWNNYYRPLGSSDSGYLDITTNGGVSWTRLVTYSSSTVGPGLAEVDLTAYTGKVVQLRFWYIAPGWDWYWYIDDVTVWVNDPWLTVNPTSGAVNAGATVPLTFTYDASQVPQPGDYTASPYLTSPDILGSRQFSVTLHVAPAANSARLAGTILGNRTISGANQPLKNAVVNVVGPAPVTLSTAADGSYSRWFTGAQAGVYTVTASYPGYLSYSTAVTIPSGVTTTVNATLVLDAAFLNANPESISDNLPWGGSIMHTLTISNPAPAQRALNATLGEIAGSYTPPTIQTVQVNVPAKTNAQRPVNAQAFAFQSARPAQSRSVVIDKLALGKIKVLLVSSDWSAAADLGGMDALLAAYPDLQVDIYPMDHVPTLPELTPYTIVIIGSQYTWEDTFDHNAMGDVMADYVDAGGKVIQAFGTMHGAPSGTRYWALGGRWQSQAYSPMTYSTFYNLYQTRSLGVYLAGHPLMQGVNSIVDMFVYGGDITVRPDAQTVAFYDNGVPYLATYPGRVVALNEAIFNGADWQGDLPTLLHNAILYLAPGDVPWLSETTTQFNLGVGASAQTNVTLNAAVPQVDQPGLYSAWLWVSNNDPLQQGAYIPVQMNVAPAATMARLAGTISSDRPAGLLADAQVVVKGPAGAFTYTTGADGKFGRWFTAAQAGTYTITATAAGYVASTATVNVTSGVTTTAPITLKLDAPWITEAPPALDVTVISGNQATQTVTLNNFGQRDLTYQFIEFPATATLPSSLNAVTGLLAPQVMDTAPLKVDPAVTAALVQNGQADFWVRLRQSVDLNQSPSISDKTARVSYVFDSLRAVADASQANLVAYLQARGLKFESYWIVNAVLVYGGTQADFQALTALPEVAEIKGRFAAQYTDGLNYGDNLFRLYTVEAAPQWNGTAWGVLFTHADQVWSQYSDKGAGVVVANIDTGVQWNHPALQNQYRGWNGSTATHDYNWWTPTSAAQTACTGATTAPCDWAGHGSHTMGTMVGDDGVPGDAGHHTGMAPAARWMACMGCDTPPNGCSDAALTGCAQWIVAPTDLSGNNPRPDLAPDVVNNSWGGGGGDAWYQSYVQAWRAAGIFPSFSIGNAGPTCSTAGSPGDYPESFGSGAVDSGGVIADFSSRGPGSFSGANIKPDLAAPGVSVCSTIPTDGYTCGYSGTSMASPHTAGTVALLWSVSPALRYDITGTMNLLRSTANPNVPDEGTCGKPGSATVPNYTYGYGYLDAFAAVKKAVVYDVSWLSESPVTGTVTSLGSQGVSVVFDTKGLQPGVYTATLVVQHNDPLAGQVRIPVTMTVQAYQPTFTVVKSVAPSVKVLPGGQLTYTITIVNGGRDSTDVAVTDWVPSDVTYVAGSATGGLVFIDPPANPATWNGTLASSVGRTFTFLAQVKPDTLSGTVITNTVTITAYGQQYTASAAVLVFLPKIYLPLVMR